MKAQTLFAASQAEIVCEREACARLAENFYKVAPAKNDSVFAIEVGQLCGEQIAEAIRARSAPPLDNCEPRSSAEGRAA